MKFDDIVHFTGGRMVLLSSFLPYPPPRFVSSPFVDTSSIVKNQDRGKPPATNPLCVILYILWRAASALVSLYPPARSVAGHLIPNFEGAHA